MISLISLAKCIPSFAWSHGVSASPTTPVNIVLPAITGTIQVGITINCSHGTWSGSPASYSYQWQNEGVNLSGGGNPTTNAYTVQTSDIGCLITCVVTAINTAGSASAFSNLMGPTVGATVIYVSQAGNDTTGTGSISQPYKSLTKVNSLFLSPGTSVLFRRGDTWRNDGCSTSSGTQLSPSTSGSAGNPIVFDAYGTGPNPVIDGSIDLSTTGAWTLISGNVWQSVHTFNQLNGGAGNGFPNNRADDVGNLIWGISAIGGTNVPPALVNASYGAMAGTGTGNVWWASGQAGLTTTGQWNFNTSTNKIQVYCNSNPATGLPGVNGDLWAAIDTCLIYFNQQSNITFQNLTLQYCAATAIDTGGAGGACNNIIVRDCVIQWIGGGNISGNSDANSRYGDGWDIEGSCQNMLVERTWFHQHYDTGPGPQCGGAHQDSITVRNCVCTYSGAFFSTFFLNGVPTANGLSIYNNTVYCTANGWCNNPSQRPNGAENVYALTIDSLNYNSGTSTLVVQSNLAVKNNIFAGISGNSPSPGFGIIANGWNVGGGANLSNPFTSSGVWLDYNCWPQNPLSQIGNPAQDIALSGANHAMSDWVQGTNIGGAGTFSPALETHGVFSQDPLFASQTAFNFALQSSSPCLHTGADLSANGVVWDFNHNRRPSNPSMGAFEISSVGSSGIELEAAIQVGAIPVVTDV